MDLLPLFSEVYGNLGQSLGTTDYDASITSAGPDAVYLGSPEEEVCKGLKVELVAACIQNRGLNPDQVIFIDDDLEEVRPAQGLCMAVHVTGQRGAGEAEFKLILSRLADTGSVSSPAADDVQLENMSILPSESREVEQRSSQEGEGPSERPEFQRHPSKGEESCASPVFKDAHRRFSSREVEGVRSLCSQIASDLNPPPQAPLTRQISITCTPESCMT
jgi:hypothetical protein